MIIKRKDGYHVISSKGKHLGGPYPTKDEALKRLKQVEYYKAHPEAKELDGDIGAIDFDDLYDEEEIDESELDFKEVDYSKMKLCLSGLELKEDGLVTGLIATTHPDRVKDILSKKALTQIVNYINNPSKVGDLNGAYRSVSLYHDWVKENNPALDEAGFIKPTARLVSLDDGNFGVEVDVEINKYYKGEMSPEEIAYRAKNGAIAGFSIEYATDNTKTKSVNYKGDNYRFIDELTEFGGIGFARARMIANPYAVIYKEIMEDKMLKCDKCKKECEDQEELDKHNEEVHKNETKEIVMEKIQEPIQEEVKETIIDTVIENKEIPVEAVTEKISVKEIMESKEFKEAVCDAIEVKSKIIKTREEDGKMLSIKELNDSMNKDVFEYKEVASKYFLENKEAIEKQLYGAGIPLKTTLQVKCSGTKLKIASKLEVKDTLDTGTNASTYTQNIVEFADVYLPVLIDTFNNQTNLFGALRKVDNMMGSNKYGWKITTAQKSGLSVDPDQNNVTKEPVKKLKLQTDIKEYRLGVSVSDYTLYHSRASMGDLFMIEVEKSMKDLMKDINKDLFTEQADGDGTKILGLEAVADSAGNTTLYGLTRSTTNRLAPDTATDTYQAVGGALTTALIRKAIRKVEVEGALRSNIKIVCNPLERDALFELEDGNLRYMNNSASMGFSGAISYDGVPIIVDADAQTDAIFVIDDESYYVVVSKAPQLVGLAKVGAVEEAYISTYIAAVYEQPRRIYMLDTLTSA